MEITDWLQQKVWDSPFEEEGLKNEAIQEYRYRKIERYTQKRASVFAGNLPTII
ncbi:hypothetical protein [Salicibibacter kimchii]|uniref:hypothetical protein n=1 Tax=Salicibibacter kimchii TaxID=2099786 RepID=UPI00135BABC4|nr:hypothetical protein [Salicibibacter kimchii]